MNTRPDPNSMLEPTAIRLLYYAAERTLMSWIRAALGMMALGFVIDRFGLALSMLPRHAGSSPPPISYSFWTGSALVFGGVALALTAAVRYIGLESRFRRDGYHDPGSGLSLGVLYTLLVAAIGVVIGIILAAVRY